MKSLFIFCLVLPIISYGNNGGTELRGAELHGCSKHSGSVNYVLRKFNRLTDMSVASLGGYSQQAKDFLEALQSSCSSLDEVHLENYQAETERLRRKSIKIFKISVERDSQSFSIWK